MKRSHVLTQLVFTGVLIASLLAPAIASLPTQTPARVHPHLAALVGEAPDKIFRVMVQKAGSGRQAEALVESLGGEVTKDLYLIHAFAAEMSGRAIKRLGSSAVVNWVSLDAPMAPSTTNNPYVADYFNTWFYNNNDGTDDWLAPWVEFGAYEGDDPISGYVFLTDNKLAFHYTYYGEGIWRSADLSGMGTAILSFDWETSQLDEGEHISVLVSDGSNPFETLGTLTGTQTGSASFDISSFISSQTTIRFENLGANWSYGEAVYIDNVKIEYTPPPPSYYLETLYVDDLHEEGLTGQGVTVAVVDSGISAHPDFTGRLLTPYGDPAAGSPNPSDSYGHGTHVAGIIGGDGTASGGIYKGVAPGATLLAVGVSDEFGMSYEFDVVEGLQWIFENKDTYGIRVVNLSLNSTVEDTYNNSGIDAAAEILWFNGVVVVAAAGNSGVSGPYNTARTAPANDPFIIVVGASDEYDTIQKTDDAIASFSASGVSLDNHLRPDLIAPGYNIYAALSPESSWGTTHPERVSLGDYIRLSGTSMAAPMVAGTVALLLEDEPNLTPDQVKYRLQETGSSLTDDNGRSWSYLDVEAAIEGNTTTEANQGLVPHRIIAKLALIAYWSSQNGEENIEWDSVNWDSVNWDSVNWDSVNWDSVNWDSINWDSVNWDSVNWDSVNWDSVNWDSVNWDSVNWDSVNWDSGGMNYLVGTNGSRWVSGQPTLDSTNGLFWGELDRGPASQTTCVGQTIEKGVSSPTLCEGQFVIEK